MREGFPLARFMGVEPRSWTGGSLVLWAPAQPNANVHGTMFGGGIAALGILAGWGWLRLELEARGVAAKVVVQDVRTHYRRPLYGGSLARCLPPEPGDLERFLRTLDRKGRARLSLQVEIRPDAPDEAATGVDAPGDVGAGDGGTVPGVAAVTEARFVALDAP